MESIQGFLQTLDRMQWSDYLDIILVAFLIYKLMPLIRTSSTWRIARTVIALLLIAWLTDFLKLYTISWILNQFLAVGLLAFVVLFQPELRRMLDHLGSVKFSSLFGPSRSGQEMDHIITQTVRACEVLSLGKAEVESEKAKDMLADGKVGALIVFERNTPLDEWINQGTMLDCQISEKILCNIFYPVSPLHDGAVIIRNGRIAAAGCKLPLTKNEKFTQRHGTRHCAAVGITEVSDAVVVVVSEENGMISFAIDHMLKRPLTAQLLEQLLRNALCPEEEEKKEKPWLRVLKKITGREKEKDSYEKK